MNTIKNILEKYVKKEIGLNHKNPNQFGSGILSEVNEDYFTFFDAECESLHHFLFKSIVEIRESSHGISFRSGWNRKKFAVLVRVATDRGFLMA